MPTFKKNIDNGFAHMLGLFLVFLCLTLVAYFVFLYKQKATTKGIATSSFTTLYNFDFASGILSRDGSTGLLPDLGNPSGTSSFEIYQDTLKLQKRTGYVSLYKNFEQPSGNTPLSASVLIRPLTPGQGTFLKFGNAASADHVLVGIRTQGNSRKFFCRKTDSTQVFYPGFLPNATENSWQKLNIVILGNTVYTLVGHTLLTACTEQVAPTQNKHVSVNSTWVDNTDVLYDSLVVTSGEDKRPYKQQVVSMLGDFYMQNKDFSNAQLSETKYSGGNSLRAGYDTALAFFAYGSLSSGSDSVAAKARALSLMQHLSTQRFVQNGGSFSWGQNLQSMLTAYVAMKPMLVANQVKTSADKLVSTEIETYAKDYASLFQKTKKSFKLTVGTSGNSRISGRFFRKETKNSTTLTPSFIQNNDVVSVDFFYNGNGLANAYLGLSNYQDPVSITSGDLRSVTLVISSDPTKSEIRQKVAGKTVPAIPLKQYTHPKGAKMDIKLVTGWNRLRIDAQGGRLNMSLNGARIDSSVIYEPNLAYVTFGTFGTSRTMHAGALIFSDIEYSNYNAFGRETGSGNTFEFDFKTLLPTDSVLAVTGVTDPTPWNTPSGGYQLNSRAEDNAWNAAGLAWLANHVSLSADDKNFYNTRARCYAYHSITNNIVNSSGRSAPHALCNYVTQTVGSDYSVENHGFYHPGYSSALVNSLAQGQIAYEVANVPVPSEFKTPYAEEVYKNTKKALINSELPMFSNLSASPDWGGGGDTLMRAGLYVHKLKTQNRSNDIDWLIPRYRLLYPGITAHFVSPVVHDSAGKPINNFVGASYIQNAVIAGEVLAPMLLPLPN